MIESRNTATPRLTKVHTLVLGPYAITNSVVSSCAGQSDGKN